RATTRRERTGQSAVALRGLRDPYRRGALPLADRPLDDHEARADAHRVTRDGPLVLVDCGRQLLGGHARVDPRKIAYADLRLLGRRHDWTGRFTRAARTAPQEVDSRPGVTVRRVLRHTER